MTLFLQECAKIARSLIYWIFIAAMVLFIASQFFGGTSNELASAESAQNHSQSMLREPKPDDMDFGTKQEEIPEQLMSGGVYGLLSEYSMNSYVCYPIGFYKTVRLEEADQRRVAAILKELTGLTEEELAVIGDWDSTDENTIVLQDGAMNADGNITISSDSVVIPEAAKLPDDISCKVDYPRFKQLMAEMDSLLGGGSNYRLSSLIRYYGQTPMSYEEAKAEYDTLVSGDRVSGAFARLFSDYAGVAAGLFPIFLVVAVALKDRRASMEELIFSRKISSMRLISTRYLALLVMMFLPLLLLSLESLIPLLAYCSKNGLAIDAFAFLRYTVWWILPTLMMVISLGMALTFLTSSMAAIAFQFVWWYCSVFATALTGSYPLFGLVIRHNSLSAFVPTPELWANRLLITGLAILLLFAAIWIYNQKRKGRFDAGSWFKKRIGTLRKHKGTAFGELSS